MENTTDLAAPRPPQPTRAIVAAGCLALLCLAACASDSSDASIFLDQPIAGPCRQVCRDWYKSDTSWRSIYRCRADSDLKLPEVNQDRGFVCCVCKGTAPVQGTAQ